MADSKGLRIAIYHSANRDPPNRTQIGVTHKPVRLCVHHFTSRGLLLVVGITLSARNHSAHAPIPKTTGC